MHRTRWFCCAMMATSSAWAIDVSVTSNADNGPGTLRAAIQQINALPNDSHRILFADTYPLNGVIALQSGLPSLTARTIEIVGARGAVLSGQNASLNLLVPAIQTQSLTLRAFTVGFAQSIFGGACLLGASSSVLPTGQIIVLDRMVFDSCVAMGSSTRGGAVQIRNSASQLQVIQSTFRDNLSNGTSFASAGAIYTEGNLSIGNSRFERNRASATNSFGGAIHVANDVQASTTTVADSVFLNNQAAVGAAYYQIANNLTSTTIERSAFDDPQNYAGATPYIVYMQSVVSTRGQLNLRNLNFVARQAGFVEVQQVRLSASHLTGIGLDGTTGTSVVYLQTRDSEVQQFANSVFQTEIAQPTSTTACLFFNTTLVAGASVAGNAVDQPCALLSPQFGRVGGFNIERTAPMPAVRFDADSPVIDQGNAAACASVDIRGAIRPLDGNNSGTAECDIGALEHSEELPLFANGFE